MVSSQRLSNRTNLNCTVLESQSVWFCIWRPSKRGEAVAPPTHLQPRVQVCCFHGIKTPCVVAFTSPPQCFSVLWLYFSEQSQGKVTVSHRKVKKMAQKAEFLKGTAPLRPLHHPPSTGGKNNKTIMCTLANWCVLLTQTCLHSSSHFSFYLRNVLGYLKLD